MHKFFWHLPNVSGLPKVKQYIMFAKMGEAWVILDDNNDVQGGLLQYAMKDHNSIISYYVPEDTRAKGISWRLYEKCANFQRKHPKKTYAVSKKPVDSWRRFAKHIKDDLYEVVIPLRGL